MAKIFISYNYIKELEKDTVEDYALCPDLNEDECEACKAAVMDFVDTLLARGHLIITDRYPSKMDEWEDSVWDAENVVRF